MDWEGLRREARQLENEVDKRLVAFSKLGTSHRQKDTQSGAGAVNDSDGKFDSMALELQQLLIKLSSVNDEMADIIGRRKSPDASVVHTLTRHRDILNDYNQEFSKTKANIRITRDRDELLSSVQRDINSYRTSGGNREELYLKEHEHIQSSDRLADDAIGIAMSTHEALLSQRQTMRGVSGRVASVFQRIPGVNTLMQKTNLRKRRDAIIMACVVSTCIILMIVYLT